MTGNKRRSWKLAVAGSVGVLLAACAGGEDFLQPAEPTGDHPFPVRATTFGRNTHDIHGIDIAKYQGDIDWHAVKRSGIAFAFIKATEGGDIADKNFRQNWEGARTAGVARGAYHFNYWCTPFRDQFEWFRRNVPRDPDAMPPVLDLEWNTHSPTCPRRRARAYAQREIRIFLRLAEAWYGKRPIIYTDIRFYRDVLSDGSFAQYPLWVRATKRLPHEIYEGRKWAFWQYSDRSRIAGIRGRVDKNAFAGTRSDWQRLVASNFKHSPAIVPSEKPEPGKLLPPAPAPVMVADKAPDSAAPPSGDLANSTAGKPAASPGAPTATDIANNSPPDIKTPAYAPGKAGRPLTLTPLKPDPAQARSVAGR